MSRTQHDNDTVLTDGGSAAGGMGRWAMLGIATYLVVGLGTTISLWLVGLFGGALSDGPMGGMPGSGGMMTGGSLDVALGMGLLVVVFLGALIATGLGFLAGRQTVPESSAMAGAVAGGAGVLVTSLVLVVLLALLGGGGGMGGMGDGLVTLFGMVVGLTIGVAITGAIAGNIGERSGTY